MRKVLPLVVTMMAAFWMSQSWASTPTGPRNILDIGCDYGDGNATICYVSLDGAPFGAPGCVTSEARWDSKTTAGKNALAVFMAAFYGGKRIDLQVADSCFVGSPTFIWFHNN
jgi:hypothetical protein